MKTIKINRSRYWLSLPLLFMPFFSAQAFYTTMDTGELLNKGQYRLGAETQFITDNDTGVNVVTRFDMGLNEDSNLKAELGFGTTDFHLGGYYKWVPYPDYQNQPAIGVFSGINFAEYAGHSELSLRVHPIISKGFAVEFGKITPYGSIPFGLRSYDDETDFPLQAALGAELFFNELDLWRFKAEVGFDINDAFTYITFGASLDFDEENGIRLRKEDSE